MISIVIQLKNLLYVGITYLRIFIKLSVYLFNNKVCLAITEVKTIY